MIFFPRFSCLVLKPPMDDLQLCKANPFCTNVAAWGFSIAGRPIEPTIACFECCAELERRAVEADLPVILDRIQPDTCYCCGRRVGERREYLGRRVGPFCGVVCCERWLAAPRHREGLS